MPAARNFRIDVTLRADALTAMMLAMVTFVSTLVAIYAVGLHARRPRLLAVLRLHRPVRLLDDDARLGQQLRAAVRLLGSGRRLQLPADRLLVSKSPKRPRPARRRSSSTASATSASRWRMFLIWTTYGTLNFHDTLATGRHVTRSSIAIAAQRSGGDAASSAACSANRRIAGGRLRHRRHWRRRSACC